MEVAVRTYARIPVGSPGAAKTLLRLKNDKGGAGGLGAEVIGGSDSRYSGADDENINMTGLRGRIA
jgi:hypothetical protein